MSIVLSQKMRDLHGEIAYIQGFSGREQVAWRSLFSLSSEK
jgi:hypothetical protein